MISTTMYKIVLAKVIIALIFKQVTCDTPVTDGEVLSRSRRQLLFPNATLLQFNAGVGTPTPIKTIAVNWAFQANFMLPWNRTQIPVDIIGAASGYEGESRSIRNVIDDLRGDYGSDAKLYHFYKFVEDVLNGMGHNGTACVLQALCQIGAEPLHSDDEEDLLHELAGFVLNPTNDAGHGFTDDIIPYVSAYENGQEAGQCMQAFGFCSTSLVDMFTIVQNYC